MLQSQTHTKVLEWSQKTITRSGACCLETTFLRQLGGQLGRRANRLIARHRASIVLEGTTAFRRFRLGRSVTRLFGALQQTRSFRALAELWSSRTLQSTSFIWRLGRRTLGRPELSVRQCITVTTSVDATESGHKKQHGSKELDVNHLESTSMGESNSM